MVVLNAAFRVVNQKQREFLIAAVDKQFKAEREKLGQRKPVAPSLNNYLTAAILDGSFDMHSPSAIRESIRRRVRDLGKGESLLDGSGRHWGRSRDNDEGDDVIALPARLLFVAPPEYAKALSEYEKAMEKWKQEDSALESAVNAMRLKIQIGSDKALETLISQADQLCSMSLTASNRLLLPNTASA